MGKFLYPIYKLELPTYKRWWLYHKISGGSGVLSDLIEGDYLVLNNSLPKGFNLLQLVGNTIQDGEPSPENEVPILNVIGKVNTKIQNKNLFTGLTKGKGINVNNGEEIVSNNSATSDFIEVDFTNNSNYYISGLTNKLNSIFASYNSNKEFLGRTSGATRDSYLLRSNSFINGTPQGTGNIQYIKIEQYYISTNTGTIDDVDGLNIQLEQGGTPTDYVPHHEQNLPLDLRSKNLFDKDNVKKGTISYNTGDFTVDNSYYASDFINVKPQTQYYCNYVIFSSSAYGLAFYDQNKNYISGRQLINVITVPENASYLRFCVRNENYSGSYITDINTVQLEQGSTATDYVPYYNYELSKIGEAQDYISKEDGKWYLYKEIGKQIFNGSSEENWLYSSSSSYPFRIDVTNLKPNSTSSIIYPFICNYYKGVEASQSNYSIAQLANTNRIYFKNTDITSKEDWMLWLSTHNTEVKYPLATPTKTEITETPLIEQLEAFSKAKAYEGQTIIYGESEEAVPNYKVKYYMKGE